MERATFAAGSFWQVEAAFAATDGVVDTAAGFMGGHLINPSYEEVHTGTTGHAEVVRVVFDPERIHYAGLLAAFWNMHDPTILIRRESNRGTFYRSVVFCHNQEQMKIAVACKQQLDASRRFPNPVVTEILRAQEFYRAEEYHQHYLLKRNRAACGIGEPGPETLPR